jgi:hypothetical protein
MVVGNEDSYFARMERVGIDRPRQTIRTSQLGGLRFRRIAHKLVTATHGLRNQGVKVVGNSPKYRRT